MKLLTKPILKFLHGWNERVYTEADAYEFCTSNRIVAVETDLIEDLGEYKVYKEKPFIFLHKFIDWRYRNWVYFHEIGHYILHPTSSAHFSDAVTKRKIEREANFVAAVALMPNRLITSRTFSEIVEEYNYPKKLIVIRKEIYDIYKI